MAEAENVKTISGLKANIAEMTEDYQKRIAVLEAAAQELEVRPPLSAHRACTMHLGTA